MLQKWILGIMLATGITFAAVGSEDKNMAVGGWLQGGNSGEHAGLDLEFRHGAMNTLVLYTSFEFSKHDNSLGVYLGYYWHLYDVIPLPQQYGRMSLYFGPAAGMGWWQSDLFDELGNEYDSESGLAFRAGIVGGWGWEFPKPVPLEFYIELNPVGEYHYMWYDDDHKSDWQLPDFYVRFGLRFWF